MSNNKDLCSKSKCNYLFIKKNLIGSGFYLKCCLLLARFTFPARTANKTNLKMLAVHSFDYFLSDTS